MKLELDNDNSKNEGITNQPSVDYSTVNFSLTPDYDYSPKYKSVTNKEWVPYGKDNDYPDRLLELYNDSVLHHALIEGKSQQILGDGYVLDDLSKKDSYLDALDSDGLNNLIENIAKDMEIYNGFAFLIHYGRNWKTITDIEYIDYSKLRCAKYNEDNEIEYYYYKLDWKSHKTQPTIIKAWNKNIPLQNSIQVTESLLSNDVDNDIFVDTTTLIYVYNKKTPGLVYYTHPEYVAAINAIITDKEVDVYGVNSMQNSLSSTAVVTFKGLTTAEAKKSEASKFIKMYTGVKKAGLPLMVYGDAEKNSGVEVTPLNLTGNDDRYTKINENTIQKILIAHRVTSPLLVGIKTPGQLGNTEEIKTSYTMFYKQVVKPKQNIICNAINKILSYDSKFRTINLTENKPYDETPVEAPVVEPKTE